MSSMGLAWFKSSYSGGECIEVAYDWRKSSYSAGLDGDCIEVAAHPTTVHVRDSKVPEGPQLAVPPAFWASFVAFARCDVS